MAPLWAKAAIVAAALLQLGLAWNIDLPPCTAPFQPFVYSGCFQDPTSQPALDYRSSLPSNNMTVELCVAECKGNGYRYAGLEYYGECFCGDSVNGPQLPESSCTYPCSGNTSETCGGFDILSVWQDPTFEPVDNSTISDYVAVGCYTDNSTVGRTLSFQVDIADTASMSTETCLQTCKDGGYPFAGTEFARKSMHNLHLLPPLFWTYSN